MIKTYSDFINVVNSKLALYAQIPESYLSIEGTKAYELYKNVSFNSCFASNATELLALVIEDEDVEAAAKYAGSEYRQIRRCLERLAAAENLQTNREETSHA